MTHPAKRKGDRAERPVAYAKAGVVNDYATGGLIPRPHVAIAGDHTGGPCCALRIEAGPFRSEATDGTQLNTDRRISTEQADLLIQVLERAGRTPDDTFAIEVSEGGAFVEFYDRRNISKFDVSIVREAVR